MNINVESHRRAIVYLGNKLFTYVTTLPKDIRPDKKHRTGIEILVRILGTRNQISFSIKKPSKDAKFFAIEKSVRSESHAHKTSLDSEEVKYMRFGGCVSLSLEDEVLHVSTSGLTAEEDTVISIIILAKISGVSIDEILDEIKRDGGKLPDELFKEGHYLDDLLNRYRH
jgi:hypothetical protein